MPARAALSGARGLPPFGLGFSDGGSGRIACQRFSPTSVFVIIAWRRLDRQRADLLNMRRPSLETPHRVAGCAEQGGEHEKETRRGEHHFQI